MTHAVPLAGLKWLRAEGANWPAKLSYTRNDEERLWTEAAIAWAKSEGCMSAAGQSDEHLSESDDSGYDSFELFDEEDDDAAFEGFDEGNDDDAAFEDEGDDDEGDPE